MTKSAAGIVPDSAPPLGALLGHWPGVFFRQRADYAFDFVSPQIVELTGVPAKSWQRQPKLFWEVVHELDVAELRQQLQRCAESAEGLTSSYRLRNRQTGRVAYISEFRRPILDSSGRLQAFEGVWLDVTRQTIAEKRLATAAWKETLAMLTMGLAHDFNNVLTGILSLSDSYLSQIDAQHPFHEGLALIKQNTLHASQLVHRIVNLHRHKTGERDYHDLNAIVADTMELLQKVIPKRIELKRELAAGELPLYVDATELRQVIINMALNAADAMTDRGQLVLQTSAHQEMPALKRFQGVRPRLPCACLAVSDNGCGIKPHQLGSIFDPFFTTKPMNKGSGLGLYNARLFVEKHHGAISVESAPGAGAAFRLWLPQADFTEAELAQELSGQRPRCLLLAGRAGKSLDSMAEFLRLHNYQVVLATRNAAAVLHSAEYHFDGVMVQVEAKEMGVLPLVEAARECRWPLKTIVQIVGCNQDELETRWLQKADLIISADLAEEVILARLSVTLGSAA
jgi:signal transduction histidine kinase